MTSDIMPAKLLSVLPVMLIRVLLLTSLSANALVLDPLPPEITPGETIGVTWHRDGSDPTDWYLMMGLVPGMQSSVSVPNAGASDGTMVLTTIPTNVGTGVFIAYGWNPAPTTNDNGRPAPLGSQVSGEILAVRTGAPVPGTTSSTQPTSPPNDSRTSGGLAGTPSSTINSAQTTPNIQNSGSTSISTTPVTNNVNNPSTSTTSSTTSGTSTSPVGSDTHTNHKARLEIILPSVIGGIALILLILVGIFLRCRNRHVRRSRRRWLNRRSVEENGNTGTVVQGPSTVTAAQAFSSSSESGITTQDPSQLYDRNTELSHAGVQPLAIRNDSDPFQDGATEREPPSLGHSTASGDENVQNLSRVRIQNSNRDATTSSTTTTGIARLLRLSSRRMPWSRNRNTVTVDSESAEDLAFARSHPYDLKMELEQPPLEPVVSSPSPSRRPPPPPPIPSSSEKRTAALTLASGLGRPLLVLHSSGTTATSSEQSPSESSSSSTNLIQSSPSRSTSATAAQTIAKTETIPVVQSADSELSHSTSSRAQAEADEMRVRLAALERDSDEMNRMREHIQRLEMLVASSNLARGFTDGLGDDHEPPPTYQA